MSIYTINSESAVDSLTDSDEIAVYDASASAIKKATMAQVRAAVAAAVVATTATTLSITAASHAGKMVVINSAAPIAVSLPAATGTGNTYRFKFGVAATGTSSTIAANGTDVIEGMVLVLTTATDVVVTGYSTSATSDKVSANGTTTGGVAGDTYTFVDAESGVWQVNGMLRQTGSIATPFSAT